MTEMRQWARWWLCLVVACGGLAAGASERGSVEHELEFAAGLVELGFPDFADRLIDRLVQRDPAVEERARAVRAQVMIGRRRFDEAEAMLRRLPAGHPQAEATRLAIANGLHRAGEVDRARVLYREFFDRFREQPPTDPEVLRFFQDAAYRYGQMMERAGDLVRAVEAYEMLIAAKPERDLERRLQVETADLLVRAARRAEEGAAREALLERSKALVEAVHWGGMDLWFGRAIPTLANIELVRGDAAEARRVLQANMDILTQIDEMLRRENIPMAFSPMAGTRHLLGALYEQEGVRLIEEGRVDQGVEYLRRSLVEYVNVFARYGESDWGPEAGIRQEAVVNRLQAMGRTVNVNWGPHLARAAQSQFRLADTHFQERQYAESAHAYLRALNAFPGAEQTAQALMNLLMSYVHLEDDLRTRASALYIADRHAGNPQAGLALLAAGRRYFEQEDNDRYRWMYERFAEAFPRHERAPAILFALSRLAAEQDEPDAAAGFLATLMERFPGDEHYLRAVFQQAYREHEAGRFEQAAEYLERYVEQSHPSQQRVQAKFMLGDSYLKSGENEKAAAAFRTLRDWLTPLEGTGYAGTAEELDRNRELLVNTSFQAGYALARARGPADRLDRIRTQGIAELRRFVDAFPDSPLSPAAMNLVGVTQLAKGATAEAAATFEDLQRRYPESDAGRSALFALVRAAMEVDRVDVARDALGRMRASPGAYAPEQFVGVGRIMHEGGLHTDAMAAFRQAMDRGSEDRRVIEQALYGLAEAAFANEDYADAVAALNDLIARYPRSGRLFDARLMQGRAYREMEQLPEAVDALREVFQLGGTDPVLMNTASVELASIQVRLAERAEREGRSQEATEQFRSALASFQRVAMLANPDAAGNRPLIRVSALQSLDLYLRLGMYTDAEFAADQYLALFPDGEEADEVRRKRADARLRGAAGGG